MHPDVPMTAACGTPSYVAPEILKGDPKGYGKEVDLWSIGIILYILLCGFPPFYDEDNSNLFALIQAAKFEFPSPYWDQVSDGAKDLVSKLLVLDPKKRYTTKETLTHPWMADSTVKNLPHLDIRENLRSFNARRRMKGLIRTVQMITMMKRRTSDNRRNSHGLTAIQKAIDGNKAAAIAASAQGAASVTGNAAEVVVVPQVEANAT
jgi:calcium/calmodulin-dependent protein kinase I